MKNRITSRDVTSALRNGPFRGDAFVWLSEVRNGTGYTKVERYADGLVLSVWPSRGIWLAGIEIKVSRSDWLRELENPEKSAAIQQWCDYWYIATPPGIVQPGELPETWGHYVIENGKAKLAKAAPKLEAKPLDKGFVASILRNYQKAIDAASESARAEERKKAAEEYGADTVTKLKRELYQAKRRADDLQYRVSSLEESIRLQKETFAALGMDYVPTCQKQREEIATRYRLGEVLVELNPGELAKTLEGLVESLRNVEQTMVGAEESE